MKPIQSVRLRAKWALRVAMKRVALGFRVHTGWAALLAAELPVRLPALTVVDRRRVEMIEGDDPKEPRFVYHAAAKLSLEAAKQLVRESTAMAQRRAQESLSKIVGELRNRGHDVVAAALIGANRPLESTLEKILGVHSLIHAAEGELFRGAILRASEALGVPASTVPAGELYARAAKAQGSSEVTLRQHLQQAGRIAGRPWAQDQKEALLAVVSVTSG